MTYEATEKRLEKIAADIGKKYGFTRVTVMVHRYDNPMEVRWTRGYGRIHWDVSTAFVRIPEDVAKELFNNLYRRLVGKTNGDYSPTVKTWIANAKKRASKKAPAPFGL